MNDTNSKLEPGAEPKRRPPNAGKGRVKGVPNKTTASVKAALQDAFERLGGVDSLVTWGRENQTEFYKLWSRMLPTEVSGPNGGPIPIETLNAGISGLSRERRDEIRRMIREDLGRPETDR